MAKNKHLTLDERTSIRIKLNAACSFRKIARDLSKSPTTISNEVKARRTRVMKGAYGRRYNACIHRISCPVASFCGDRNCRRVNCSACPKVCNAQCEHFEEEVCPRLAGAPYVCNGCEDKMHCTLSKYEYMPTLAHKAYRQLLSETRVGFNLTQAELSQINELVKDGLKRGLSPYNICEANKNSLICSPRTIYRLIDARAIESMSLDLPFKVRYKTRKNKKPFKIDKTCRVNRTYDDFLKFMEENPDSGVVEMDSVIGTVGGKVLLTLYFRSCGLLLLYLRDANNAQSVIDYFNRLNKALGDEAFRQLFPVLLGDNGSEFSNPLAIEYDENGKKRTCVFYCDPASPNQKPGIEGAHKTLRRILPTGTSFDDLTQEQVSLITANINSLKRRKLNGRSPADMFSFLFGQEILAQLQIQVIPSDKICLTPDLLKQTTDQNENK